MDKNAQGFLLGTVIVLIFFAIDFFFVGSNENENENEIVWYYIDQDTQQGADEYNKLFYMNYTDVVAKYGEPHSFTDIGNYWLATFKQIRIKKKDINMWCMWSGRYDSYGSYESTRKGTLIDCKAKSNLPEPY